MALFRQTAEATKKKPNYHDDDDKHSDDDNVACSWSAMVDQLTGRFYIVNLEPS